MTRKTRWEPCSSFNLSIPMKCCRLYCLDGTRGSLQYVSPTMSAYAFRFSYVPCMAALIALNAAQRDQIPSWHGLWELCFSVCLYTAIEQVGHTLYAYSTGSIVQTKGSQKCPHLAHNPRWVRDPVGLNYDVIN
jgi:hypothetical protein